MLVLSQCCIFFRCTELHVSLHHQVASIPLIQIRCLKCKRYKVPMTVDFLWQGLRLSDGVGRFMIELIPQGNGQTQSLPFPEMLSLRFE